jgi:hypothetical protein
MFGFDSKKSKQFLLSEEWQLTIGVDQSAVSPRTSGDNEAGFKNEGNHFYDANARNPGEAVEYDDLNVVCPPHTTEKKLMAKIDLRVIPFLCILYLLAFLDRVNIGNARSFGLAKDLNLQNVEYNTALTICMEHLPLPSIF